MLYVGNFSWFKERGGELLAGTKNRLQASIKVDFNLHSNPQQFLNLYYTNKFFSLSGFPQLFPIAFH